MAENSAVEPGRLYVVATPIGNLGDASARMVEVLGQVDVIAAEDTRKTGQLLTHFGLSAPLLSTHEHNEQDRVPQLIRRLQSGESVALVSDAGTPTISDPGFRLVAAAHDANIVVTTAPGPSALISALSVSGLPTDRFVFEGFLPGKAEARSKRLLDLAAEPRTLVFYESPRRALASLSAMAQELGEDRRAFVARELTKTFETLRSGTLGELVQWLQQDPEQQRGEWVIVASGSEESAVGDVDAKRLLKLLLPELGASTAAKIAAKWTGLPRRHCYDLAQSL